MPEATTLAGAADADIGVHPFLTTTPGLGGRLKVRIEDFVVEEESEPPPRLDGGRFTAARIRLANWETNAFIREASGHLQRSRHTIHFSGTKDRRGVTERWFTFESTAQEVLALNKMGGVEVLDAYATDRHLELGEHEGNRFRVVLRNIAHDVPTVERILSQTWKEIEAAGGVPNFFGPQRFGARRATTHRVGERILRGDFIGACLVYLTEPGPGEDPTLAQARRDLAATRDWKKALTAFVGDATFERALLHRLIETDGDGLQALLTFPTNLQRMFVSAVQSHLYNEILSRRIQAGHPLRQPIPGDIVAPVDEGQVLDEWIPVEAHNVARVAQECERGCAVITAALPGFEAPLAEGPMGDIERAALKDAGLEPQDFIVPERLEWSSKGTRRPLLARPRQPSCNVMVDEYHPGRVAVEFRFGLAPGTYATSVLREFMKSRQLTDYA